MRISSLFLAAVLIISAFQPAQAWADDAVSSMAKIMLSLQHFPSDADKAALAAIVAGDSSDSVKTVASAIAGINHKVSSADQTALMAIAEDESEPADLRQLAGIVAGVNHVPGAEAKAALTALAGG